MLRLGHDLKIRWVVVLSIAIYVMNYFSFFKWPADHLFGHDPVLVSVVLFYIPMLGSCSSLSESNQRTERRRIFLPTCAGTAF